MSFRRRVITVMSVRYAPFLAAFICYRIDFLLARRQRRMGNWTPVVVRSAHRLWGLPQRQSWRSSRCFYCVFMKVDRGSPGWNETIGRLKRRSLKLVRSVATAELRRRVAQKPTLLRCAQISDSMGVETCGYRCPQTEDFTLPKGTEIGGTLRGAINGPGEQKISLCQKELKLAGH